MLKEKEKVVDIKKTKNEVRNSFRLEVSLKLIMSTIDILNSLILNQQ